MAKRKDPANLLVQKQARTIARLRGQLVEYVKVADELARRFVLVEGLDENERATYLQANNLVAEVAGELARGLVQVGEGTDGEA